MSTTSSEAGLLVGGFLRPFLSYNKDTFCRALLRCSPSLSFFLPPPAFSLPSSHFLSVSLYLPFSFLLLFTLLRRSLLLLSLFLSLSSLNKCLFLLSAVFFFSPSLLRSFCVRFSFSFLLLFRAHLYLICFTRFAPLVVLSCILFLFSQFRLLACSLLSFVLVASFSPCCSLLPSLSFHCRLFSPLTRARSPAARASEVFLNRSTTGGCYRAALFSSQAPKSLERRD